MTPVLQKTLIRYFNVKDIPDLQASGKQVWATTSSGPYKGQAIEIESIDKKGRIYKLKTKLKTITVSSHGGWSLIVCMPGQILNDEALDYFGNKIAQGDMLFGKIGSYPVFGLADQVLYGSVKMLVLSSDGVVYDRKVRKVVNSNHLVRLEGKNYEAKALMLKLRLK